MDSILLILIGILFITNGLSLLFIAFQQIQSERRYNTLQRDYKAAHEALNRKRA